jgi:hypothetical protein
MIAARAPGRSWHSYPGRTRSNLRGISKGQLTFAGEADHDLVNSSVSWSPSGVPISVGDRGELTRFRTRTTCGSLV